MILNSILAYLAVDGCPAVTPAAVASSDEALSARERVGFSELAFFGGFPPFPYSRRKIASPFVATYSPFASDPVVHTSDSFPLREDFRAALHSFPFLSLMILSTIT